MLIALMGSMLIFGAFNPPVRFLVLTVAGLSKVGFIALILVFGQQFLSAQARVAVVSDVVQVAAFVSYMIAVRRLPSGVPSAPVM